MSSNIILTSKAPISSDAESFYRDYWQPSTTTEHSNKRFEGKQNFICNGLLKGLLHEKTILEIGVGGEGGMVAALLNNNSVHGVDVSESAIVSCRAKGIPVEKINCDRDQLPYPDGTFDVVFALEVFEHFSNPQFVIEQIRRVMKPDGHLVISTPAPYTYHWPRLFYPSLFERSNFQDFLLLNRLLPTFHTEPFSKNLFAVHNPDNVDSSWSYYWLATKLQEHDKETLYNVGKNFLMRKDEHGMRVMPMEALEFLKESIEAGNTELDALRDYLCALYYRFVNGDDKEFSSQLEGLMGLLAAAPDKPRYAAALIEVHRDAEMFGFNFFNQETLSVLTRLASSEY